MKKTACATLIVVTAKDKHATSRLAKLNSSTIVTEKLQGKVFSESACCMELEEELSKAIKWVPQIMKKEWQQNSTGCGGAEVWNKWIVQIILELLSHHTPLSCIPTNILTIAESLHPNMNVVQELPGLSFVRDCCSVLVVVTKTIAAYQLGKVDSYKQLFSNGTSCRHTAIQNVVFSLVSESGYEMVTLSSRIIAKDKMSQSLVNAVGKSFAEGQSLLEGWRETTSKLFPEKPHHLELIPQSFKLTLVNLGNGGCVLTDKCNAAQKFNVLLMELIKQTCIQWGYSHEEMKLLLATPKECAGWCCCASIEEVS